VTAVRNAATALATTVLDELARGGVRHLVVAPGSRSAPLAYAALAAADDGRVTIHTRVDERTAGFLALGLAKSGRRPVAVVCTSGTAVANLHPAVLEASHAGVPLVLLTADRPAALRLTRANQTADQPRIFGDAVRLAADVPPAWPGGRERQQVAGWRALAARAALVAGGRAETPPGPVHLNLQLAEPLTPDTDDAWAAPLDGRPGRAPWVTGADRPAPAAERLDGDRRTVVLAGDDAGPPARMLAEAGGWPLLAEPSSGSRTGANAIRVYRLLLADEDLAGRIERVLVAGHPTLSRPVHRLLGRSDVDVVALVPPGTPGGWTDPGHQVCRVVRAADAGDQTRGDTAWLREWLDRDAATAGRLDALLDEWAELTPHHVARAVARALPAGGLLVVGASNPIRDLDLMVPRYPVGEHRLVLANRGLSGVDGTVSTAVGAALGRPRTSRALALLGDVTFLHDANGLVLGPDEPRPDLTVVVVNDDGGSIFAGLEPGRPALAPAYERLFGTPHGVDLAALCAATRTPHRRVGTRAELAHAVDSPAGGVEVVEAVVRRDDRRALEEAIRGLV
jgi:2-succinyl-5-enolpyruvyl-6-hydroxy-3-cyclohexene-1-carboxylate synthase